MISLELPFPLVDLTVDRALAEDLASGDITTEACIDVEARATAHGVAREADRHLRRARGRARLRADRPAASISKSSCRRREGARAAPSSGASPGARRSILMGERVALNFAQRMSGVATATRTYVDAVPSGSKTRITDTRKTTPGLRLLERYAVRAGGGKNHRDNLGSAVLIKDNHIAACGGVAKAIVRARDRAPAYEPRRVRGRHARPARRGARGGRGRRPPRQHGHCHRRRGRAAHGGARPPRSVGGITLARVAELAKRRGRCHLGRGAHSLRRRRPTSGSISSRDRAESLTAP